VSALGPGVEVALQPGAVAVAPDVLALGPVVEPPTSSSRLCGATKRTIDVIVAVVLLVLLAPLLAVIALCVVVDSGRPAFYRARRVGQGGRPLDILKFRKMHAQARGGPLTVAEDARFTRIGRWLAATKLDELPQLINVIQGRMSLVGPRPEDPLFVALDPEAFDVILQMRPGLTGLAQLAFRHESEILDPGDPIGDYERRVLPQKIALDRLYARSANAQLDFEILAWTAFSTILGIPVSVNRTTARMAMRLGGGGRRRPRGEHETVVAG
jgi:lipopolysaccharide/colanic/teichoic acid biosynthesis glycosyltransferase